jgi:hypothetical protein
VYHHVRRAPSSVSWLASCQLFNRSYERLEPNPTSEFQWQLTPKYIFLYVLQRSQVWRLTLKSAINIYYILLALESYNTQ